MELDLAARRNLELTETLRGKEKKGSLLWVLDKTRTPMGGRMLRSWLERPLLSVTDIHRRSGAVAALAFAFDMPLVLIPVGIIYILETLSDIIQVGYFKITHGKRFFKMAPLHHHLERCGWSEVKICLVFGLVALIGGAIALACTLFGV